MYEWLAETCETYANFTSTSGVNYRQRAEDGWKEDSTESLMIMNPTKHGIRYYTKPSWIFCVSLSHFTATFWIALAGFLFAILQLLWWQFQCPLKWCLHQEIDISFCLRLPGCFSKQQCAFPSRFFLFVCFNPPFCMTHCMLSMSGPAVTNYLEILKSHCSLWTTIWLIAVGSFDFAWKTG